MEFKEKKIKHVEILLGDAVRVAVDYIEQAVIRILQKHQQITGFCLERKSFYLRGVEFNSAQLEMCQGSDHDAGAVKDALMVIEFIDCLEDRLGLTGRVRLRLKRVKDEITSVRKGAGR